MVFSNTVAKFSKDGNHKNLIQIPLNNYDSLMILLILVRNKYLIIRNTIALPNDDIISVIKKTHLKQFLKKGVLYFLTTFHNLFRGDINATQ